MIHTKLTANKSSDEDKKGQNKYEQKYQDKHNKFTHYVLRPYFYLRKNMMSKYESR